MKIFIEVGVLRSWEDDDLDQLLVISTLMTRSSTPHPHPTSRSSGVLVGDDQQSTQRRDGDEEEDDEEEEEDGDEDPYNPQDVDEEGEDELLLLVRRDGRVGVDQQSMQRSDGDEVENEEDEEDGDEEDVEEDEVDEEENDDVKQPHLHHSPSESAFQFWRAENQRPSSLEV